MVNSRKENRQKSGSGKVKLLRPRLVAGTIAVPFIEALL
jgi:hypothetical protein